MGRAFDGSYAKYTLLPNAQVYPITSSLSWSDLAAVPETYYTAFGSQYHVPVAPEKVFALEDIVAAHQYV